MCFVVLFGLMCRAQAGEPVSTHFSSFFQASYSLLGTRYSVSSASPLFRRAEVAPSRVGRGLSTPGVLFSRGGVALPGVGVARSRVGRGLSTLGEAPYRLGKGLSRLGALEKPFGVFSS